LLTWGTVKPSIRQAVASAACPLAAAGDRGPPPGSATSPATPPDTRRSRAMVPEWALQHSREKIKRDREKILSTVAQRPPQPRMVLEFALQRPSRKKIIVKFSNDGSAGAAAARPSESGPRSAGACAECITHLWLLRLAPAAAVQWCQSGPCSTPEKNMGSPWNNHISTVCVCDVTSTTSAEAHRNRRQLSDGAQHAFGALFAIPPAAPGYPSGPCITEHSASLPLYPLYPASTRAAVAATH
jgi:hypothetical protein